MSDRVTKKEKGLIKGALRRVFSRSEARKEAVAKTVVLHRDISRPRVTRWSVCPLCGNFTPTYQMEVDHRDPVIPTTSSLAEMSYDTLVSRIWCDPDNLLAICKPCHKLKSKEEAKTRRKAKKEKSK